MGKMFIQDFNPFKIRLFQLLLRSHLSFLYIFEYCFLLHVWFLNIFSHSVGFLFILSALLFALQNHFGLIQSLIFLHLPVSLESSPKSHSQDRQSVISPLFHNFKSSSYTFNIVFVTCSRSIQLLCICIVYMYPTAQQHSSKSLSRSCYRSLVTW